MAAPTNAANLKKVLANSEPSTHGTSETFGDDVKRSAYGLIRVPDPIQSDGAALGSELENDLGFIHG
jgi:hypothetical protein